MSTAGKVLTVLIMLVTVVWLVMMSAVTQLNVNWQQKIIAQEKNLEQVTTESTKAQANAVSLTAQTIAAQEATELLVLAREEKLAAAMARRSSRIEDLNRLKAQVADEQAAAQTSKTNLATREAEIVSNQDELAKKRDEIAKSKAVNADLRSQLAQLQADFKRLLAENTAKLDKAAKGGAALPASSVRGSGPSS